MVRSNPGSGCSTWHVPSDTAVKVCDAGRTMTYHHLVSLGSSMAAGPGIVPIVDKAAMRSGRNYPHLLAERLGARLTDLTVSGATTATVLDTPQRTMRGTTFEPQINGVPADTDLATVTIGGNDLKYVVTLFAGSLFGQVRWVPGIGRWAATLAQQVAPLPTDDAVAKVTEGIASVVERLRERAPGVRVVLVDYLTFIGPDTRSSFELPLHPSQLEHVRAVGSALEGAFAAAAAQTGADLVRASEASRGHAIGSSQPWVVGLRRKAGAAPFHPNAEGMRAVADLIADQLAGP